MNTNDLNDAHALLDAKEGASQPTRRTAMAATAGAGFAAAVLPVTGQTLVQTSIEGLTAGKIQIEVNGFSVPAYRAMPKGAISAPAKPAVADDSAYEKVITRLVLIPINLAASRSLNVATTALP